MSEIGRIKEFDETKETFTTYVKRLKLYFTVNNTDEAKKKSIFLLLMGPKVYQTLINLAMPKQPEELSFEEIENTLTTYFEPAKLEIVQRFQFSKRDQKGNETVNEYAVELKKMAITCNFGTFLQEALRDRFVSGLRNEKIQKDILVKERNFNEAVKFAVSLELIEKESKEMMHPKEVNFHKQGKMYKKEDGSIKNSEKGKDAKVRCKCCGKNHLGKCKYLEYSCKNCGKKGHLMKACTNKKKKNVQYVEDDTEGSESESDQSNDGRLKKNCTM